MLDRKHEGPVSGWDTEPDGDESGYALDASLSTATPTEDQAQLACELEAARQSLDRRTEAMAMIACWRDQLRRRLASANIDEFDELAIEVDRFKRHCKRVTWTPSSKRRT
jgi:hypothetical protein